MEADAGLSQVVILGSAVEVSGRAFGGTAPYSFAWTHGGSGAAFGDATAANTTFDTTGLSAGTVTLTLTVTDALGATDADDVLLLAGPSPVLLSTDLVIPYGLPEESALPISLDRKFASFTVPSGTARIEGTLSWAPDLVTDIDFALTGPGGATTGDQGVTTSNPEVVALDDPSPGTWLAEAKPWLSLGTTAHVEVRAIPSGDLPRGTALPSRLYGTLDAQTLTASATGGTAPYSFAWDTDGDGRFETSGATVTLSRGAGAHSVSFKVADAAGFEAAQAVALTVLPAETVLKFICGADPSTPYWAMEWEASGETCWMHGGHHTYFLGDDAATLREVHGFAYSVEQQFAPPLEVDADPTTTLLRVEASMDGVTWTEVGTGEYVFLPEPADDHTRQYVQFHLTGLSEPFRLLRVHEPLSATQGLSGYLDHTELMVAVDDLDAAAATPAHPNGTRALSCWRDILEDFFLAHPCWYGGADRYDAPSFHHTYPLVNGSTLTRAEGSFVVAPWRADDWYQGRPVNNATEVNVTLLTSVDGQRWTTQAVIPARFLVPTTFDVTLPGDEARFVQLLPERHARFSQTADFAPNHHPKGFMVDSSLTLTGTFAS